MCAVEIIVTNRSPRPKVTSPEGSCRRGELPRTVPGGVWESIDQASSSRRVKQTAAAISGSSAASGVLSRPFTW